MDSAVTGKPKCEGAVTSDQSSCTDFRTQTVNISKANVCSSQWSGTTRVGGLGLLHPNIYPEYFGTSQYNNEEPLALNFHVTRDFIRGSASYEAIRDRDGNFAEIEYVVFGKIK